MERTNRITMSFRATKWWVIAGSFLLSSAAHCSAENVTDSLSAYLRSATADEKFCPEQGALHNNVTTGLSDLATRISVGVSTGLLNSSQASTLQAELSRIEAQHAAMGAGGYTYAEAEIILNDFSTLYSQLSASLNYSAYNRDPSAKFDNYDASQISRSTSFMDRGSVLEMLSRISNRISTGLHSGRLTPAQAQDLQRDYNSVARDANGTSINNDYATRLVVRRMVDLDRRTQEMVNDSRVAGRTTVWQ